MKRTAVLVALGALIALPAWAGEWHSGGNNLCTDCHTMHFSMQHNWDGTTPVPTTPAPDGNWLGATGPNHYLLKLPVNLLCLTCHDGQTFAPDVYGTNTNASPTGGRMAGALNGAVAGHPAPGAGYDDWKGHTLESVDVPPGYNPAAVGIADWYDETVGLECINCHAQHGPPASYRNLGPFSMGGFLDWGDFRPTYVIDTTNDITVDVWVDIPAGYTANSGLAATFNPYYAYTNIRYNSNTRDPGGGTNQSLNRVENLCGACHGTFHGGPGDPGIGGTGIPPEEFDRHPSNVEIGAIGGGHSGLGFYQDAVAAASAVKVYTNDHTAAVTVASPGCVTCHKAHGNQNPFGMFFLSAEATAITEEGGYAIGGAGVAGNEMPNGYGIAYQNLCGQCHTQGINPHNGE